MHPTVTRPGRRLGAIAIIAAVILVAAACEPDNTSRPLPIGGALEAANGYVFEPNKLSGANDWNCRPSDEHPNPVVLVPGTFTPFGANWVALSPMLKNAGYCVYALNYGMTSASMGRVGGIAPVASSAAELDVFVDRVLAASGAAQVDLVGHSQGGMMPNYYIKRLGGAPKVHTLIGLAPSNHGTTAGGLVTLADQIVDPFGSHVSLLDLVNGGLADAGLQGLVDQVKGSPFQRELFADGDTVPGVNYVVIATAKDWLVTPYTTAFLDGAKNITIQDQCPNDPVSHAGIFLDSPTLQNVLNELSDDPDENFQATCSGYGWPI